jgi:hypothetical protein
VGKMFYRGAPRLLASNVRVEPCRRNCDPRVAVEAYPAVVARRFLGRSAYKRDGVPDTPERRSARETLLSGLASEALREAYGFAVEMDAFWRRSLSATLPPTPSTRCCAGAGRMVLHQKDEGWGVPLECDPNEGWLLDPALLTG